MSITRREILATPALAALLRTSAASAAEAASRRSPAPGDLTRLAIVQDCVLLALRLPQVSPETRDLFSRHLDFVLLGRLLPSAAFLDPAGGGKEAVALAFVARLHGAVHAEWQEPRAGLSPAEAEECSLYQDVAVLRASAVANAGQVSEQQFLSLLETIHRRLFIEIHTFEPDAEDVEAWIDRLVAWNEDRERLLAGYARGFARPEPAKTRRFLDQPPFYDRLTACFSSRPGRGAASASIRPS